VVLEMIGDIPDADVKPPDNVLFVCKLNKATQDDDLQIIFSRFGHIRRCEVIRDRKTGESLNYAFIEFERPEDCEQAYFKMDNVLIDDRRIHVDFSQSVSKLWNKFRRKEDGDHDAGMGGGEREEMKDRKRKSQFVVKSTAAQKKGYDMVFKDEDSRSDHRRKRSDRR